MTSARQVIANRKNSLNSTGPKTLMGKVVVSKNALQHGVLSCCHLLKNESRSELEAFEASLLDALSPYGALEELLVQKITAAAWRLRRVSLAEAKTLDIRDDSWGCSSENISDCFDGYRGNRLTVISRYEIALERSLYRALQQLQSLQSIRANRSISAPICVDVV